MSQPTDDAEARLGPAPHEVPARDVVLFRPPSRVLDAVDLSLGLGAAALAVGSRVARVAGAVVRPVVRPVVGVVLRPPLIDRALTPEALLRRVALRGNAMRTEAAADADLASRALVPAVTDAVVERIDLTDLVLDRVDLTRIVAAVLDRIDLTALVLERVDLDRIVAAVDLDAAVARVDLDAAVARVDLDAAVARVDLDAAVARVDLDAAVDRVDVMRVVEAVLERLDLTALVLERVDLDRIVGAVDLDAAVAEVDLDAAVARVDLVGIANYVVDAIDLSEIIRTSTGSVASEAVRGVRMQTVDADEQLQKVVDRVLLRRRARRTKAPEDAEGELT